MADMMAEPSFGAGFDVREVLAGFRGIAEGLRDLGRDARAAPAAFRDTAQTAPASARPPRQSRLGAAERKILEAADRPAQGIAAAAAAVDRVSDLLRGRLDALDEAVERLRQSVETLEGVVGPAKDQTQAARTAG